MPTTSQPVVAAPRSSIADIVVIPSDLATFIIQNHEIIQCTCEIVSTRF